MKLQEISDASLDWTVGPKLEARECVAHSPANCECAAALQRHQDLIKVAPRRRKLNASTGEISHSARGGCAPREARDGSLKLARRRLSARKLLAKMSGERELSVGLL